MTYPVNVSGQAPTYNTQPQSRNGVTIDCYTIDPTKLPPNHPLLQQDPNSMVFINGLHMPACNCQGGGCCYPSNYYTNNYGQKKRVTVLTDELIQKYDQLLSDSNKELREYAASEVIKRLQEDKTRYDDEGLNVLVNKMLVDPYDRKVRQRGINAISLELAQGNADTKQILEGLSNNPNLDDHERGQVLIALSKLNTQTMLTNAPMQGMPSVSVE